MLSIQNQVNKLHVNRTADKPTTGCALWDTSIRRGGRKKTECFRVRAGVFASAHGRPNGVPGRIIGARAKTLRGRGLEIRDWRLENCKPVDPANAAAAEGGEGN